MQRCHIFGILPPSLPGLEEPQSAVTDAFADAADAPVADALWGGRLQVSEEEIQQLFGSSPGFQQIKLNRGARGVTCFVEFTDVASAMVVHQQHQARFPRFVASSPVQCLVIAGFTESPHLRR